MNIHTADIPRRGIPLRPDPAAAREALARPIVRGCMAALICANSKAIETHDQIAARLWPHDRDTSLVLKAASVPATLKRPVGPPD